MFEFGEIRMGRDLGYKTPKGKRGNNYMWVACVECGKGWWVVLRHSIPESKAGVTEMGI